LSRSKLARKLRSKVFGKIAFRNLSSVGGILGFCEKHFKGRTYARNKVDIHGRNREDVLEKDIYAHMQES
jgi:hypothetical protein